MEQKIKIKDIPGTITLGELATNVQKAHRITKALAEGRYDDALSLTNELFIDNDAIIERNFDKAEIMKIITAENLKRN